MKRPCFVSWCCSLALRLCQLGLGSRGVHVALAVGVPRPLAHVPVLWLPCQRARREVPAQRSPPARSRGVLCAGNSNYPLRHRASCVFGSRATRRRNVLCVSWEAHRCDPVCLAGSTSLAFRERFCVNDWNFTAATSVHVTHDTRAVVEHIKVRPRPQSWNCGGLSSGRTKKFHISQKSNSNCSFISSRRFFLGI